MAILTGLIALVVAAFYGGWEWVLLSFVALVALWHAEFAVVPILTTIGVSYFCLALFHWTSDRRIFFPYTMQLAVQMPDVMKGRVSKPALVGGGGIIAVFMLIRITQSATADVLIVELFIAITILTLVFKDLPQKCSGARVARDTCDHWSAWFGAGLRRTRNLNEPGLRRVASLRARP